MKVIKKLETGSYEQRLQIGAIERPHYGYCVYNAAFLAKRLGLKKISVLEYGVAQGNGLVNLEYHAQNISRLFSIDIDVYGFDAGEGLPEPLDYRDIPYHWKKGLFKMDIPKLKSRLKKAELILGDIRETSKNFFQIKNPAPIGAIVYDFDFYSSTVMALKMLEADEKFYLPRVFCYFDNIIGGEFELHNDFIGERLAISEFNAQHKHIKFGLAYYLLARKVVEPWYHQIYICHLFEHNLYNNLVRPED